MNTTQIKWNTGAPSFDAIKGKTILITWDKKCTPLCAGISTLIYYNEFNWNECIAYAILTDEPVYCEYIKDSTGNAISSCDGKPVLKESVETWKVCPYCANPIRIIEEVKPEPLDGFLPVFESTDPLGWKVSWIDNHQSHIFCWFKTKPESITAWNSFVDRMKK